MLNRLRKEIDEIDAQLLTLFERRMDVARQVGAYKKERGLPVFVPEREKAVIKSRTGALKNAEYTDAAADFFTTLMALSRRLQQAGMTDSPKPACRREFTAAAYLGRPGSYSEEALCRLFPQIKTAVPSDSFAGVLSLMEKGEAEVCILPVENTSTGAIDDVMDLVYTHGLYIIAETAIPIRHVLAAPAGAELSGIRQVYSHPQGFLQCADFLSRLKDIETISAASTADSALTVAESGDLTSAAIVSRRAAELYGLTVLQENIQTADTNTTRFIAVSREMTVVPEADVISLAFTLRHKSGSLYEALSVFAKYHLNVIYIQSRPLPGRKFEYRFFADFSGHVNGEAEQKTIEEIRALATEMRILGCYPAAGERTV